MEEFLLFSLFFLSSFSLHSEEISSEGRNEAGLSDIGDFVFWGFVQVKFTQRCFFYYKR